MAQLVELLGHSETRDELGLGVIRDTFPEGHFPGMSTVQRRMRYFLFVPWMSEMPNGGSGGGVTCSSRRERRSSA